jgi:hypothetical protein
LQGTLAGEANCFIHICYQPFPLVADIEFFKLQVVGGNHRISAINDFGITTGTDTSGRTATLYFQPALPGQVTA